MPLHHVTVPLQPLATKVTMLDGQEVGPLATVGGVQVGATGQGLTVTGAEGALETPFTVQVAT